MHFVAALDRTNAMRCVLCLFEGVATGAADGFARMADTPAATLLHLGPGPRQRAGQPAQRQPRAEPASSTSSATTRSCHRKHDAPLASDIEGTARTVSAWVRTSQSARRSPQDTADAIVAARTPPGQVATPDPARRRRVERRDGAGRGAGTAAARRGVGGAR